MKIAFQAFVSEEPFGASWPAFNDARVGLFMHYIWMSQDYDIQHDPEFGEIMDVAQAVARLTLESDPIEDHYGRSCEVRMVIAE